MEQHSGLVWSIMAQFGAVSNNVEQCTAPWSSSVEKMENYGVVSSSVEQKPIAMVQCSSVEKC